jgi:signal transduction histidine kinase
VSAAPVRPWLPVVRRLARPPLRDARFWLVQLVVLALAMAHLALDIALPAEPSSIPAGVPVALLLAPVSYAALHHGLSGSVATALSATLLWLPDLLLPHDRGHPGNDLIELALVIAVAVFAGYHIDEERAEGDRAHRFAELLLKVQEEERRRIAHELHDEPLQLLVHLGRTIEWLGEDPAALPGGLTGAREQILDIAARIRSIVAGLRPPALEQLGLVAAVRGFLADVAEATDLNTDLTVHGEQVRLAPDAELGAYRIAQEAANNAVRHANARNLAVTVAFTERELRVRVADDGRGFDPGAADAQLATGHLGMPGMRERAALVGGRLTVQSRPGRGTVIEAVIPIPSRHR